MDYNDIITLAIAFGLGMLVGLQRQHSDNAMAGVRTFTLISVLGVISGFLTREYDNPYILPAIGLSVAALLVTANVVKLKFETKADIGQTTEVAALLMFAIGAYLVLGSKVLGVIMGGTMAVLLYAKERLHDFIERLKAKDLAAIMTFAAISLVILPILPDQTYGPYDVLNPRNIWLMVTLIVGISIAGYFIYKFVGKKVGSISNGILGGLISSTATTVSYARKTKDAEKIAVLAAFVVTVASAIALVRVMVEVGVIIPEKLPVMVLPLALEFVIMAGVAIALFYYMNKDNKDQSMPEPDNPAQFKSALIFGLLYGFILLAVAFTKDKFGDNALYVISIISGLTDVDAITLSLSNLIKVNRLESDLGWKLILLASLSNLAFKGVMAATIGSRRFGKWIGISFGISILAGLAIMFLWPDSWHF
ncbi:MgtC/SapB family protein [Aegicerativicinus sediminis]|uniref:MgtC/SapB family protein n=1 Tax=Aegicerativicinus sediminis TaxID=2893202 RepID=UPI001E33A411|nr:MgtC/SapB family protein [Aegicerativicinus sediminis]